ncbi:2Fe-2S iron-sulfur cluster-binding protein [Pelagibius marinus]|uniref:2Fe-2S iron-sulfur cluster-binding protein n=1 Tax=Pelagibius marinus TaxID=2762760 RepID=UPI0018733C71|nr:2Fe-2S iron-sulfur cluster-binding protein [Pelagibius marinus]
MKVKVTDREGGNHELPFQEGDTLMQVLTEEDLGVRAECGGCCACATCHVYVGAQWLEKLPAQSEEELSMLDEAFDVAPTSRLSCQVLMTAALDGMEVTIAPDWD